METSLKWNNLSPVGPSRLQNTRILNNAPHKTSYLSCGPNFFQAYEDHELLQEKSNPELWDYLVNHDVKELKGEFYDAERLE